MATYPESSAGTAWAAVTMTLFDSSHADRTPQAPADMEEATPRIEMQDTQAGHVLAVRGDWTAASLTAQPVWDTLTARLASLRDELGSAGKNASNPAWSLSGIDKLDYLGAQVLWNQWGRTWPAEVELAPEQRVMLETVEKYTVDMPPRRKAGWSEPLLVLGSRLIGLVDHLKGGLRLVG